MNQEIENTNTIDNRPASGQNSANQPRIENPCISRAKHILRGTNLPAKEMYALAEELKSAKAFNYARWILASAKDDALPEQDDELDAEFYNKWKIRNYRELKLRIYQQWGLCTYKDTELSADQRLNTASDILLKALAIDGNSQETLGLIGAVYKLKWEVDNQKSNLERSYWYYYRGYQQGAENDQGYTGINAAFILDLLAQQDENEAKEAKMISTRAAERRKLSGEIRQNILNKLLPIKDLPEHKYKDDWWFYSTIAEAHFGLEQYDEAIKALNDGKKAVIDKKNGEKEEIPDWISESTIRQLARIAVLQSDPNLSKDNLESSPPWRAIKEFFGNNPAAVRSAFVGKIGLGLSGGGFRASLFHIGTLAKLAELDVLRHVEVLSCVSGGSIIGAHYYLEARSLLQRKSDAEITKQDYIEIVQRIEKDFLEGVQRNIRMRVVGSFTGNLKMFFSRNYSRSMRAGELYEEEIFSRIKGAENKPLYMDEVNICPKGESENFTPKLHNWRRTAKAPILILNATTLNTGHNWQFTTTWMGEPPSRIDVEVDTNDRLRRLYYTDAPDDYKKIRLGHAVSASAAVPGLFDPLTLEKLYPSHVVRLVDGGVCDNQGLNSLLEQDCTVILVSDGSGQMETDKSPSNGPIGVLLRSNSILQARIRDAQYHDLERRRRSLLLRGLMFIHLKEDLDTDPVDWDKCLDPFANTLDARSPKRSGILTGYEMSKKLQARLAAIRTDLDSFSDIESYALMISAYRMTHNAFKNRKCVEGFSDANAPVDWNFLKIKDGVAGEGKKSEYINSLLSASSSLAFKIWRQDPLLKITAGVLGVALVVLIVWLFIRFYDVAVVSTITLGGIGKWIAGIFISLLLAYLLGSLVRIIFWRDTLLRVAMGVGFGVIGWLVAFIHLKIFDKMFLKRGSIESFERQQ